MKTYKKIVGLAGAIGLAITLTACATPSENGTLIGGGAGALGGAAVGAAVGHPIAGAAIGGVAGGATGYAIGRHEENQEYGY